MAEQRLCQHQPARGVDADPVAVERHVDPALGAEVRVGLPGDIAQEAGGETQARRFRVVLEDRGDPAIAQGTVAGEATEVAANLPRSLHHRIEALVTALARGAQQTRKPSSWGKRG